MAIQDIRRAKLQAMVDALGLSVVAKRFKKPDRQINDMLAGRKSFGEKVARAMEDVSEPKVPNGFFDQDDNTITLNVDDKELLQLMRLMVKLPPKKRTSLRNFLDEEVEQDKEPAINGNNK
ncbi:putative phage repressor [Nitrosomonas sp. Is79A3]|uniref:hypothetical protein n=1 Tax=Nitrosomonas sp. (strain Is79A3) TaxID=261292 RepID=UPI000215CFDA